ncbi:MAG: anhydro-N-acetylmuramic acid kinase [Deltaproteobacteria bacterium]|jgi:anhydro-N-acetylmuramic acid kinase|nr:anhydro-N-acetylmuramic acid kinase [Deltaproteobacteria bacterium]
MEAVVLTIGIMTGNSLDAVDLVLTEFTTQGSIKDLTAYTLPYPQKLSADLRTVRAKIEDGLKLKDFSQTQEFQQIHDAYLKTVAQGVENLLQVAEQQGITRQKIDAIGFHGQTCGHNPPSIAKSKDKVWTIQIGSGQMLADLTGLTVIYDFRSDDILNGGEGAPLAPVHNLHIAIDAKARGFYPLAFCNAGNTGNITIVSEQDNGKEVLLGWDVGPFNHFIDMLVRYEKGEAFDEDGKYGRAGKVNEDLLREMFNLSAVRSDGSNFLLQMPPKSSDPQWYCMPNLLKDSVIKFEDRLRTVEYFSVYIFVYTLRFVPAHVLFPNNFLIFGGGWKNPIVLQDFKDLLCGRGIILNEHKEIFNALWKRFIEEPKLMFSDEKSYSAKYMEARIMADMAYCRLIGEPFSLPETTGCKTPTVGGIIRYPQGKVENATENFRKLLEYYQSADLTLNNLESQYYSRACPGYLILPK